MSIQPRRLGLTLACALALMSTGCVVSPLVVDNAGGVGGILTPGPGGRVAQGNNPVIQAFTANPMATADKDAKITFTVVANSPTGAPLQYNWSATKGLLSSNTGQMVYWSPTKADGSLETPGDAQISVIITNATGGSQVGTATVKILADGTAKVGPIGGGAASPAPSPSPSPVASASPSPSPSPSASASPAADTDASGTEVDGDADTDASGTDVDGDADTDASGTDVDGDADTDASGTDVEADEAAE